MNTETGMKTAAQPAWYRTPVATIPLAAAAFVIGNLLLMIPWQVF